VPEGSWILVDGTSPRASRWALALAALFLGFAVWNTVSAVRLVARVRDEADEERDAA
jgi:tellurite resistance protein TehA-like permease